MNLWDELGVLFHLVVYQFQMIFPYWISGVIAGSVMSVFAFAKINMLLSKMNTEKYGLLALIPASILGAASPICMYGTIPLIASLGKRNVPQYLLAAFMVSSILINPNLFLYSFSLGTPLALTRLVLCLAGGILAGCLVKIFFKQKRLFHFEGFTENKKSSSHSSPAVRFFSDINRAITITAPYFLIGILLAALFERYFPKDIIINLFGPNKGFGVLMAASLGMPVYVCGGGTIPLLRAWLQTGMTPGAAMAFMITGPATKITNLSAVKIILGAKNFGLYIIFNVTFAVVTGVAVDLLRHIIG